MVVGQLSLLLPECPGDRGPLALPIYADVVLRKQRSRKRKRHQARPVSVTLHKIAQLLRTVDTEILTFFFLGLPEFANVVPSATSTAPCSLLRVSSSVSFVPSCFSQPSLKPQGMQGEVTGPKQTDSAARRAPTSPTDSAECDLVQITQWQLVTSRGLRTPTCSSLTRAVQRIQ